MKFKFAYGVVVLLSLSVGFAEVRAESVTSSPAVPAPQKPAVEQDSTALSAGFWTDWKQTKVSAAFTGLTAAVDCGCTLKPQSAAATGAPIKDLKNELQKAPQQKTVIDIAITKPEDAANLMSETIVATQDPVTSAALATVLAMRISPEVREVAVQQVAPEARQRIEEFRADLSTGIPGLPGIYLGDNDPGGQRADAPQGYTPVAGPSAGCRTRQ